MKLNLDTVRIISCGAERIEEKDGKLWFYRFTEPELLAYEGLGNPPRYKRLSTTAGVRLAFKTDSSMFAFSYELSPGSTPESSVQYFDIYISGVLSHHFGAESKDVKDGNIRIELEEGEKDIEVYFPWSANAVLYNITLDDGAFVRPIKRSKNMLCYGDSITHGYCAVYPSLSYALQLSRLLDADIINKGIGGDNFFDGILVTPKESIDYITVAYGTNDWVYFTETELFEHCSAFCKRLSEFYPNAKIFVVTPIRRLDKARENRLGKPVTYVAKIIKEACKDIENITVIDGWNLTPALPEFYSDSVVHPNDIGFGIYAMNLYKEIKKYI